MSVGSAIKVSTSSKTDAITAVRVSPANEHVLPGSTENATGKPDDAVAAGVYCEPVIAFDGPVKVIVCGERTNS